MTEAFAALKVPLASKLPAESEWTLERSPFRTSLFSLRLSVFGLCDNYIIDLLAVVDSAGHHPEVLIQQCMEIQVARTEANIRAAGLRVFELIGSGRTSFHVSEFQKQ
jgi:hypothetical protein